MKTNIALYDHSAGVFVQIRKSKGKYWERFVSKNKKKWIKTHNRLTLEDALKQKEEVINSNYKNLYKILMKK